MPETKTKPETRPPIAAPAAPDSNPNLPLEIIDHPPLSKADKRAPRTPWVKFILTTIAIIAIILVVVLRDTLLGIIFPPPPIKHLNPDVVYALARLEPLGEIRSVSAQSGSGEMRIEELRVDINDTVKKGDILAVLDSEQRMSAAVQIAEQTLAQSKSQLAQTQLQVETTRKQLEASLRAAEHQYDMTRANLIRSENLRDQKALSDEVYQAKLNEARSAEEAITEATAKLERYQTHNQDELVDITVARQQIDIAKANLEQAKANLETSYITAPVDGTILDLLLFPGERVGSSPLLIMGDTAHMMAKVEVYESDIPRLHLNQKARITATPLKDPLTGQISRIANYVQKQQIVDADPAAFTDARVVEVWVRLDEDSSPRAAQFVNLQVNVEFLPEGKNTP